MSLCFDAEDTEAAVVVVESDPLDYTGDFLGRGSAFWDRDVHAGIHFPMGGLPFEGKFYLYAEDWNPFHYPPPDGMVATPLAEIKSMFSYGELTLVRGSEPQ